MLNKRMFVLLLLLLLMLSVFNIFALTPLARISTYSMLLASVIGHFIFFRYRKYISRKIQKWYWIGLILMIVSGLTAHFYYGQSLISGFVANFNFFSIGAVIFFVYLFQKYQITFPEFFAILTKVSWVMLVLLVIMTLTNYAFINESELTGKIVVVDAGKVNKGIMNFIGLYWFSMFLFRDKYKYLVYSLLFFSANHFTEIQRFILLVTLITVGIGLLKIGKLGTRVRFIIPVLFSVALLGIFVVNTEEGAEIMDRFYEAFKIFSGSSEDIRDTSTAARIYETAFALERIEQHPLLGNGLPRASEVDKVIGEGIYFHVSDIGLFGIMYAFGLFGIYVFIKQVRLLWHHLNFMPSNQFHASFVLTLLLIVLFTLLTGSSILSYHTFFLLLCLLSMSSLRLKRTNILNGEI